MTIAMKQKILAKVPDLAQKILENEGSSRQIRETVEQFSIYGSLMGRDVFFISDWELDDHVKQARRMGLDIVGWEDGEAPKVVITRAMKDGTKYVATYTPAKEA